MIEKLKRIKPTLLITHLIITLAYPAVRAFRAESNRLLVFTDALTIVALVLLIGGILYSLVLHGFFDATNYFMQRGIRSFRFGRHSKELDQGKSIDEYLREVREKREDAFNYPLFLGIVYLLASVVLAYGPLS